MLNTWSGAGFVLNQTARSYTKNFIENKISNGFFVENSDAEKVYISLISSMQMAIDHELPLFSQEIIAPEWKVDGLAESSSKILNIVWEEVSWLPAPETFSEAISMSEDDNINGLREAIDIFRCKLIAGDTNDISEIRELVRKEVQAFEGKSWASQVSRFATYIALPIGVAETLISASILGITMTATGAIAQSIADLLDHSESKHWLSLGKNYVSRK